MCQPPRDFHVHQRQRDRNPRSPPQDFIQAAVAGVKEVLFVRLEAQFPEQIPLRRLHEVPAIVEISQPVTQTGCDFIDLVQPGFMLQIRELNPS